MSLYYLLISLIVENTHGFSHKQSGTNVDLIVFCLIVIINNH